MTDPGEDVPLEGPDDAASSGVPWASEAHPLVGRQTTLIAALRWAGLAAWLLAAAGALLPGAVGTATATALVVLLIAVPIARCAWLCVRWVRRGDPRYAAVAGVLVLIALSGVILAS